MGSKITFKFLILLIVHGKFLATLNLLAWHTAPRLTSHQIVTARGQRSLLNGTIPLVLPHCALVIHSSKVATVGIGGWGVVRNDARDQLTLAPASWWNGGFYNILVRSSYNNLGCQSADLDTCLASILRSQH